MHRHGYKGTKFGRTKDQRRALLKSLADSLVLQESIETTLPKAKEVARYTEKLVGKAKKGDLHSRRQVINSLMTLEAAHKLVDELAPKLAGRTSGYFRVIRSESRRGDNAQLAKVSFVDDFSKKVGKAEAKPDSKVADKTPSKQEKPQEPQSTKVVQNVNQKISSRTSATQAAKRTGRRGDR